jgi:hypothetical protein
MGHKAHITTDVLTYTPIALTAVQEVEAAAASLPGATKNAIATAVVLASAKAATAVPVPPVQAVGALISLIVTIFNATGIFKKKSPK